MDRPHTKSDLRFDTVRVTAWFYAAYWITIAPAAVFSSHPAAVTRHFGGYAFLSVCAAIAAGSAAYRKRIGYYFCFFFSGLILFVPPIGTILGWNMLRALRQNRNQFGV